MVRSCGELHRFHVTVKYRKRKLGLVQSCNIRCITPPNVGCVTMPTQAVGIMRRSHHRGQSWGICHHPRHRFIDYARFTATYRLPIMCVKYCIGSSRLGRDITLSSRFDVNVARRCHRSLDVIPRRSRSSPRRLSKMASPPTTRLIVIRRTARSLAAHASTSMGPPLNRSMLGVDHRHWSSPTRHRSRLRSLAV